MSANDKQVGGDHYRVLGIQPWDYIAVNRLGYFEGCIVKYVTRWRDKGGVQDLEKALHYLQKLIEVEHGKNKERITVHSDHVQASDHQDRRTGTGL